MEPHNLVLWYDSMSRIHIPCAPLRFAIVLGRLHSLQFYTGAGGLEMVSHPGDGLCASPCTRKSGVDAVHNLSVNSTVVRELPYYVQHQFVAGPAACR